MKKCLAVLLILALFTLNAGGCNELEKLLGSSDGSPASTGEDVNFRLLISDEANAIGDFEELNVTITSIGMHQGGESASWTEIILDPAETVDLVELQDTNATAIWSGQLADGEYTKVFIYVSDVEGILNEDIEGEYTIKLPGGKLHISQLFDVIDGEVTEFVYDITVVKAGESGQYIIQPQIAESGPGKDFEEVD
jgi:hypothetical protein